MYSVVICDDKPVIREALKATVDWQALGCSVVGDAADGRSAVRLCEKLRPEIVITDIRMPRLDGLELTQHLKRLSPTTLVIVITAYDEFDYAQRALRYGAFELILKPVDDDYLFSVLASAVQKLDELSLRQTRTEELMTENRELQQQLEKDRLGRLRRLVLELLAGRFPPKEASQQAKRLSLPLGSFVTFAVALPDSHRGHKQISEEVRSKLGRLSARYNVSFIDVLLQPGELIVLMTAGRKDVGYGEITKAVGTALLDVVRASGSTAGVGISLVHDSIAEAPQSLEEAEAALAYRFVISAGAVHYDEVPQARQVDSLAIATVVRNIQRALLMGHRDVREDIRLMVKMIAEDSAWNIALIKSVLYSIILSLHVARLEQVGYPGPPIRTIGELYRDLQRVATLQEAHDYVDSIVDACDTSGSDVAQGCLSPATRHIVEFIREHYVEQLTLTSVAGAVSLSPSYVSRLVKAETGMRFTEVVHEIRIAQASRLLRNTTMRVYEVASAVGIENYVYFYQLFRRHHGVSPNQYRREVRRSGMLSVVQTVPRVSQEN